MVAARAMWIFLATVVGGPCTVLVAATYFPNSALEKFNALFIVLTLIFSTLVYLYHWRCSKCDSIMSGMPMSALFCSECGESIESEGPAAIIASLEDQEKIERYGVRLGWVKFLLPGSLVAFFCFVVTDRAEAIPVFYWNLNCVQSDNTKHRNAFLATALSALPCQHRWSKFGWSLIILQLLRFAIGLITAIGCLFGTPRYLPAKSSNFGKKMLFSK